MAELNGSRVAVAVGGGISAYKVVQLVRNLIKRGASVRVMMTRAATRFVHPTSFAAISGSPVAIEMFDESGHSQVDHLEIPHHSDLIIVAPATADLMAKMAAGIGDDLVTTALLAARCPVLIAPAMNSSMWEHPATIANARLLAERGIHSVGPAKGEMAAPGEQPGVGRMSEPEQIEQAALELLTAGQERPLAGLRLLVTAGRTEEPVDSVRVITNRSSGRMGVEIARQAQRLGAEVTLVHGAMDLAAPAGVRAVPAMTARAMLEAVEEQIDEIDVALYVAAVSDWRPAKPHDGKMSRETGQTPSIEMVENPDIAAQTAARVRRHAIGFALEMEADEDRARAKLERKGLSAILLNTSDAIGAEDNQLSWIDREGQTLRSPRASKQQLAAWILQRVQELLNSPAG